MRRIGLYLGFPPEGGGAFQYAQSVLSALIALPDTRYRVVVVYSHPAWEAKLDVCPAQVERAVVSEAWWDAIIKPALRFGFPLSPWRAVAPYIHPLTRLLHDLSCDLWFFPAQDICTYATPVTAVRHRPRSDASL